ncbi:hypothetical protein MKW98_022331 [Papaver atlanticum]|uniref:G domain-containing protein n=1 Tax=Papaver atlanticum TaxID=357466 RepID=A0AAD4XPA2_9MAGN|nr:hypothetical protein MKW98_022331 [Papaver atlanticum]
MKALRVLRVLSSQKPNIYSTSSSFSLFRFYSAAQSQSVNDSIEDYEAAPSFDSIKTRYAGAYCVHHTTQQKSILKTDESSRGAKILARALLEAGMEKSDVEEEEDMIVKEEDQKSLSVGIIGSPNAGKSALTNFMVGSKVAAVSRKTNTTTNEVLGVMTNGNTQMCFFDTPGLMLRSGGHPCKSDVGVRVESAWGSVNLYDVPDMRVIRLINHVVAQVHPKQKRVFCMNKVDFVENKKDLLKVAKEFGGLPGYERYFMISGLKGSGVKDLSKYLMEQACTHFLISLLQINKLLVDLSVLYLAVKRPWEEDPTAMTEDIMKNISLEVVREKLLDHIHQEIPYTLEHLLIDWKDLKDGSLRIEQHLIVSKPSQRRILIGEKGSKISCCVYLWVYLNRRIGMEANEELRSIFKKDVHLIIQVRVA